MISGPNTSTTPEMGSGVCSGFVGSDESTSVSVSVVVVVTSLTSLRGASSEHAAMKVMDKKKVSEAMCKRMVLLSAR